MQFQLTHLKLVKVTTDGGASNSGYTAGGAALTASVQIQFYLETRRVLNLMMLVLHQLHSQQEVVYFIIQQQ